MAFPVFTTAEYVIRLAALIAAEYPGTPDFSQARLYKNDIEPDANMTALTFEEADYTGYLAKDITMAAPTINDQGLIVSRSGVLNFPCAAGVATQTIYGVYFTTTDGNVFAAQRFNAPQVQGGEFPTTISGVWRTSEPLTTYGWIDVES